MAVFCLFLFVTFSLKTAGSTNIGFFRNKNFLYSFRENESVYFAYWLRIECIFFVNHVVSNNFRFSGKEFFLFTSYFFDATMLVHVTKHLLVIFLFQDNLYPYNAQKGLAVGVLGVSSKKFFISESKKIFCLNFYIDNCIFGFGEELFVPLAKKTGRFWGILCTFQKMTNLVIFVFFTC